MFQDSNLTWYTENPYLAPCFEKTVLVWVPCIFLWVFSSLDIFYIVISKTENIPWNWRNISKLGVNGLLIVIALIDFIYALLNYQNGSEIYPVDIVTPVIKIVSLALCFVLTLMHRKRGQRSSGVLFLFWLLASVLGIPEFRTDLESYLTYEAYNQVTKVTYMIYFCLEVLLLFLNFFADLEPKESKYPKVKKPCPEAASSFPSRITFSWFDSLAILGFRRPLLASDLWSLNYDDMASEVIPKFDKYWNAQVKKNSKTSVGTKASFMKCSASVDLENLENTKKKPSSILLPLCQAFGSTFIFGAFLKLVQDLMQFVSPQILSLLIAFVESNEYQWRGYFYAVLLFLTASIQTLLLSQYFNRMFLVGIRIRTALISAIYRKALRLSNSARKESTVGEIVNLMAVDAQRFMDLTTYLNLLWSAPLQIALALYFLWEVLGPSVFAGLAVMIVLIPVNGYIAAKVKSLQIRQMKNKDERVKMMNEILSGIKVLKLYAWEPSFEKQVLKIRDKEMQVLKEAAYFNATTSFIWACAPFLVSLVTFAVYVLSDENNVLDSKKAFVSLSLFNILRFPLSMLPMMITNTVQASVSVNRINKFMNAEELDPEAVIHEEKEVDPLVIEDGTFSWGGENSIVLRDINLRIKEGSLVAVVGAVGAAKSSLLSAFLGEMDKITGRVNTKGSIAYVPQLAWIQNATLQDNILFGKSLEKKSYHRIVDSCALKQDIDMLPGGDQTEIGEKGINLSGGQKQRVSLARAVYANADVYFLDDPLSAVDSHVGKHIFENVIGPKGLLHNKTRLLVTHSITYLPEVDLIIVLKDGGISESGTYKELLDKKGAFSEFLLHHLQEVEHDEDEEELDGLKQQLIESNPELGRQLSRQRSTSETSSMNSLSRRKSSLDTPNHTGKNTAPAVGEKLIEAEKAETGGVKWAVYSHYLKSIGPFLTVATVILNIIYQGFSIFSNLWLSIWTNDQNIVVNGTQDVGKRDLYLGVYGALGAIQILVVFFATASIYLGALKAALLLHNLLLHMILHVSTTFFDVTPLGRLINRFSKDVDTLDNILPLTMRMWTSCLFSVIATLVVISYSTPIFISIIVPIGIIYYFIQRFYVATSRQLKRLESISRSPIYSHFGETVTGSGSIRAYGVEQRFIAESEQKVDFNQVCCYPGLIANRWLAIRLEMIGNLIIFFSALFAVVGKDSVSPGLVGLSVTYALQITQTLNWLVRMTSEVETNIVAVERIKEYEETPQEAPWEITPCLVGPEWPEKGNVEFKDFKVRYREGLELVLKGISFNIQGGEKVGIVGRTGAGKSSLTLSLFRIIESAGGSILIDGIDISKLGLHTVRSRLTIIPQDPVLFSGTLRLNLDPFDTYTDEQVWASLEHAHLKAFVKGLVSGLQHEVAEGGDNLSVGQRQLICLARALLRKTQVLVLDEATAAVDLETDELIQETIRKEFSSCTVLTIAHRINTIMDSDKVIVLDKGLIVEYDSPENLLKNKSSVFYGMARDAGLV
ncbi:hypothetical protein AAG570_006305 [Ranatra chinensis]|uniref:ABC-type glutathione-S-conjugate transporter n=1 Tax=Ranatra chinensis TaxID=642074 RepID=A0ABD0ZGT3_9HEMI